MANFLIDNSPYSIDGLFHAQNCELKRENARLRLEIRTLRERLKEIEWADNMFEPDKKCHVCGGYKNRSEERLKFGHKEDCWLDAELDKLKGVE